MPPFNPAPNTDGIIEECVRTSQEQVRKALSNILRQEGLERLANIRDDKLRAGVPMIMRESPMPFILQQMSAHHENCSTLLQRVKADLHRAVDEMLAELANEASVDNALKLISEEIATRPTRRPEIIRPLNTTEPQSQPRAPLADMEEDPFAVSDDDDDDDIRSITMAPSDPVPPSASASKGTPKPPAPPVFVETHNVNHSRTTSPISPQTKRSGPEAGSSTPSKRAKTAVNTPSKTAAINPTTKPSSAKGKKAEQAKKQRDPDDDEYQQSQTQSDAEGIQAALQEGRRRELGYRAARAADPNYKDIPLRDDEFVA